MRREDENFPQRGRKGDVGVTLPSDVGNDFDEEDEILTYKPIIKWEPPPSEDGEQRVPVSVAYIQEARQSAEAVVAGYDRVIKITDAIQKKIDERAKSLVVTLDPKVDAATISAIKRRFPELKDPTQLDFATYKKALACAAKGQINSVPRVTKEAVLAARQNPSLTNFGGFGEMPGMLRSEINGPRFGNPVDLEEFQKNATLDLFKMMESLIAGAAAAQVKIHEITNKHG